MGYKPKQATKMDARGTDGGDLTRLKQTFPGLFPRIPIFVLLPASGNCGATRERVIATLPSLPFLIVLFNCCSGGLAAVTSLCRGLGGRAGHGPGLCEPCSESLMSRPGNSCIPVGLDGHEGVQGRPVGRFVACSCRQPGFVY